MKEGVEQIVEPVPASYLHCFQFADFSHSGGEGTLEFHRWSKRWSLLKLLSVQVRLPGAAFLSSKISFLNWLRKQKPRQESPVDPFGRR